MGTTGNLVSTLFRVLPNFHKCFYYNVLRTPGKTWIDCSLADTSNVAYYCGLTYFK